MGRILPVRRALLVGALAAGALAVNVWATGGFSLSLGVVNVSSRNPTRPLLLAALLASTAVLLRFVPGGRTSLAGEWAWWRGRVRFRPIPPIVVLICLCAAADVAEWWRNAPLWLDEQMIAINLRDRSFADLTGALWLGQSAPLGWLWTERAMLLLFGTGERVLRFVPLLFGVGTLAAAAWIGRHWLTPLTAGLFVLLCWRGAPLAHYRFELKHYSADVFFALLLPALAAWTTEAVTPRETVRRQLTWFVIAGVALWFANGALFVAPGCVLWMLWRHVRARDFTQGARFTAAGLIWLSLFAGHYMLSLRYTHENTYLRNHWSNRVPPADAGILETIAWFGPQLAPAARDAGGSRLPVLFWMVGVGGLILARRSPAASVYVTVPVAAFVLAAVRLVPFYERFLIWITPALYFGVVVALTYGWALLVRSDRSRRPAAVIAGGAAALAALVVSADLLHRGWRPLDVSPIGSNHAMDDRSGVRWLMQQRLPGDAIVTTRLGWSAIRWYGGISLADHPDGVLPDGTTFYEVTHDAGGRRCGNVRAALQGHRRILYYASFPDFPDDVLAWLEREVLDLGILAARREFTSATWAAVIRTGDAPADASRTARSPDGGCVDLGPAARW